VQHEAPLSQMLLNGMLSAINVVSNGCMLGEEV